MYTLEAHADLNRKFFPKAVTFNDREAKKNKRGTAKLAVNHKYNLVAFGWKDSKAFNILSSVDGDEMGSVLRQIKQKKEKVQAPMAVKKFNKGMQAVDRFDQLMSLFPLAQRHPFKKWYKKLAMALLDYGLVNAEQHYWMEHPNEKKADRKHRFTFRLTLCNQMHKANWTQYEKEWNQRRCHDTTGDNQEEVIDLENEDIASQPVDASECSHVDCQTLKNKAGKQYSHRGRSCQVCIFEGRGYKCNNVLYCTKHKIRACPRVYEEPKQDWKEAIQNSTPTELEWLCPETGTTCWEKAHHFYFPRGLWGASDLRPGDTKDFRVTHTNCKLVKKRDEWMLAKGLKEKVRSPTGPRKGTKYRKRKKNSPSSKEATAGSNATPDSTATPDSNVDSPLTGLQHVQI